MKNRDKMSKINLIMSVISLDIVIVILCFNLGKIYLTIILGIGIIIELNLLIRYLTERNLTEKSKLEYSNSTKRHSAMKFFGNQPSADGGKNSFCDIQEDYNDFIKLPLLCVAARRGERVACAMESRGLGRTEKRTYYKTTEVTKSDWLFLVIGVIIYIIIVMILVKYDLFKLNFASIK